MDIGITISDREIRKALKKFDGYSKQTQEKINYQTTKSAYAIHSEAVNNCPVRTGRLRSSLHVKTDKNNGFFYKNDKGEGFNGTLGVYVRKGSAVVGTNVEYAGDVEYREVKTEFGKQPFLSPAAEKEKPKYIAAIKKILNERPH